MRKQYRSMLATAIAVLAIGVPVAAATVFEHGHYQGEQTFSYADCGVTWDVTEQFWGSYRLRMDTTGQAFLARDTLKTSAVFTNRATGKSFLVERHGVFNEIRATHVEDTVYEFEAIEVGQPFVIRDLAGNVVLRDRGNIRRTYRFDTLGDSAPGGVWIEDVDTTVSGPHPVFDGFCEVALQLTT